MRVFHRIASILRAVFRSAQVDADLADELRFHIDRETEANLVRGMTAADARRTARLRFGSVDDALETSRDQRPGAAVRQVARDLRFGARMLFKSPAFSVAAITIVGLGVSAVTAIFSVVYGVMLRPLPFRDPDRLVTIWSTSPSLEAVRLYPNAADAREWRRSSRTLQDVAEVRPGRALNLIGSGEPERLRAAFFSPNLFELLGVTAALGRTFAADEDQPGHDDVVLLSDGLWRRRFGADPGIVNRRIPLNGIPHTVIGVMPASFQYPSRDYDAWVPLVVNQRELARQEIENYIVVARLAAGATVRDVRADLGSIARRLEGEYPEFDRGRGVLIEPMLASAIRDIRAPLVALLAASAGLLLIACLNLSNLLAARATIRTGEFAVRLALGASRMRLLLQTVTEVLPLLVIGGLVGIGGAMGAVRAFVTDAPPGVPRLESVTVSMPVVLVSIAILIATGVAASLAPAIQAWRVDFTSIAKDGGRATTIGRRHIGARRIGVAAQLVFAVPLLVGASLLIRSSAKLAAVELGFRPDDLVSFSLEVPRTKYRSDAQLVAFHDRILDAARAVPGVLHAGLVNRLPLVGNQTMSIHVERAPGSIVDIPSIDSRPVTPDYFAAMGIAVRSGRPFTARDDAGAPGVAIVDERLANAMWPRGEAVGKRLLRFDGVWCTVIGVVSHIHANGVDVDPRPQVYWSYRQVVEDRMVLVARTGPTPTAFIAPIVRAIHAIDPEQPVSDIRTMDDVVDRSIAQRQLTMWIISAFGAIATVLASVGVYGVIAYGVTQRRREFGIRAALGATRRDITSLVIRETAFVVIIGVGIGLLAAVALAGLMRNLVFGVAPRDGLSLVAAPTILFAVGALAAFIPARRASAVDPALTLRAD